MIEVEDLIKSRSNHTDENIINELTKMLPLADDDNICWKNENYWNNIVNVYLALADISATRKLIPAIHLLLERAAYGNPNEIMSNLRHNLETIVNPNWSILTDICIETYKSSNRLGTKLWSIAQLVILTDIRAKSIFEEAILSDNEQIREYGVNGLERLADAAK